MSEIPADIASSAAQAGYQAHEVDRVRGGNAAGQANAAKRVARAVNETDTTVDTDDADAQVYGDAEGTGSKGKPFEDDAPAAGDQEDGDASDSVITEGEDGRPHLDLQA